MPRQNSIVRANRIKANVNGDVKLEYAVIKNNVNALLRDGLRLSDVSVEEAERKQSHTDANPGVIIARLKNKHKKKHVMKELSLLKDSRQFSKMFIHHDQHPSERSVRNNFRRIVSAMKFNSNSLSGLKNIL